MTGLPTSRAAAPFQAFFGAAAPLPALALSLLLLLACGLAHAQYIWIDEKGVRHYSDRPPESNVPASRIIKSPAVPEAKAGAANSGPAADAAPSELAQKNADFKKRRSEQLEKDKKAAEDAARKSSNKAACERMAQYQKTLASGERITQPGPNGERRFLTEEQRVAEMKENAAHLNDCKNAQ
jgi:hypothetical protein